MLQLIRLYKFMVLNGIDDVHFDKIYILQVNLIKHCLVLHGCQRSIGNWFTNFI